MKVPYSHAELTVCVLSEYWFQ